MRPSAQRASRMAKSPSAPSNWAAIAISDSGTRRPGMSIKLTNSRRLFVTTVAAGLLAWTHGTANATLLPGEGVGLYTDLQSIGEGLTQGDAVYYNSALGVIGPVTAPGVTTVFAPTFPFYTPVLTTTPGTLQPGAVSAGLSLVTGPDQATVSASLAAGSIKTYLTGTALTALQPVETDGYTTGILSDGLTWQVAGGGAAAVTISAHVDGTLENNLNIFTQSLAVRIEGTTEETMSFQGDSANSGLTFQTFPSANQGWVSEAFSDVSATGFNFTGVFDVTNGEYTPFYLSFEIDP